MSSAVVYAVVFLLVFCEDALFFGFVLPGETVLVMGAALANQGGGSVWVVWGLAAAAAILGDSVGYEIGKRFGPQLRVTRLGRRIGEGNWARATDFVKSRGGVSVFIGRWIALLRALVPPTAGMAGLPYRTFLIWNAIGAVAWVSVYAALGYLAGDAAKQLAKQLSNGILLVFVVVAVIVVAAVHIRRHRRRARRDPDPAMTGSQPLIR